jgi:hypothetical protein
MASTTSKLNVSKTSPRSQSQTRLVATKAKPQKLAPAPKARTNPPPPPASIAKNGRWSKPKPASVPPRAADVRPSVAPAPTAGDDRATRSGVSKNELKAQFAKLSTATAQIGGLKRALNKTFYEIGTLLNQIRDERLFEVKGYGSLESFVEREIDINKAICLKAARIAETIHREHALAAGLERAAAAVAALDGETEPSPLLRPGGSPAGGVPLHKQ